MQKESETNPISLITKLMGEILKESCNTSLDDQIKYIELLNSKMLNAPVFHAIIQSLNELKDIKNKPTMYQALSPDLKEVLKQFVDNEYNNIYIAESERIN